MRFCFFWKTGINYQKSLEMHVFMLIQTKSSNTTGNREKMNFWFFYETEKSLEEHVFMVIQTKSGKFYWKSVKKCKLCFQSKLVRFSGSRENSTGKIRKSGVKAFFIKTGKNYQKSWKMHVFILIQTKSGQFYWNSVEIVFCFFLMKLEKFIRNFG